MAWSWIVFSITFFSLWVLFHERSQFTGQQGKWEGIYLTSFNHFHPLHIHLDISRAITAESSPLHIASSRTRTGNLWFPIASRKCLFLGMSFQATFVECLLSRIWLSRNCERHENKHAQKSIHRCTVNDWQTN